MSYFCTPLNVHVKFNNIAVWIFWPTGKHKHVGQTQCIVGHDNESDGPSLQHCMFTTRMICCRVGCGRCLHKYCGRDKTVDANRKLMEQKSIIITTNSSYKMNSWHWSMRLQASIKSIVLALTQNMLQIRPQDCPR